MNATKNLTLVISEEFTVNNPEKLEALTSAVTRSVPTDSKDGKLHAKVFLAEMPGGSDWVLVGSANLTDQGLFFNQEACILLSSLETGDRKAIADIKDWFAKLYARSRAIDMKQAKAIWAAHGGQKRMPKLKVPAPAPGYYALKTTSGGSGGKEHWGMFEEDSAVAIGWEGEGGFDIICASVILDNDRRSRVARIWSKNWDERWTVPNPNQDDEGNRVAQLSALGHDLWSRICGTLFL